MTRFEMIGMGRQYAAVSSAEATRQYNISCERCSCGPRSAWHDCAHCAIDSAHNIVMRNFELMELNKNVDKKLNTLNKKLGLA